MKATRIDDIIKNPDGSITVHVTEGDAPLPATWSGTGLSYASVQQFVDDLTSVEVTMGGGLLTRIQLAKGYKADPTLGATFLNTVRGKTATLDLTGSVQAITLG